MPTTNPKVTADPQYYLPDTLYASLVGNIGAQGWGTNMARKVVTFDGTATKGQVGAVPLFTVTSAVIVRVIAICTADLVSAGGGTISVGTPATVNGLIAVTTATDIDAGDIWFAAAPATVLDTLANAQKSYVIGDGADIQGNVLVADITGGSITFICHWTPITATGNVVAA